MRPGPFLPGNPAWLLRALTQSATRFNEAGGFHPGNSLCGTPCTAWVFHRFCERWLFCLLVHANCFPNAYHNTAYLLDHASRDERRILIGWRRSQEEGELVVVGHTGIAGVKLRYLSLVIR